MADSIFRGPLQTRILPLSSWAAVTSQAGVWNTILPLPVPFNAVFRSPLRTRILPVSWIAAVRSQEGQGSPLVLIVVQPGTTHLLRLLMGIGR